MGMFDRFLKKNDPKINVEAFNKFINARSVEDTIAVIAENPELLNVDHYTFIKNMSDSTPLVPNDDEANFLSKLLKLKLQILDTVKSKK